MADAPECLDCGACCFSTLPTYVRVYGEDHARLGEEADRLTHFLGHRCYMRMEGGRCAALSISAEEGRFYCTVYEHRPAACRELERGSPECEGERALKGERPPIELGRARAKLQGDAR